MGVSVTHYVIAGLYYTDDQVNERIEQDDSGWDNLFDEKFPDKLAVIGVNPMMDVSQVFGVVLAHGHEYDGTEFTKIDVDTISEKIQRAEQNIPEFFQGLDYQVGLWSFSQYS